MPTSFWSDQYGVRIQFLGRTEAADRVEIDGDLDARDFAVIWWRGRTPVAALLVGRPRALAQTRRLIAGRANAPADENEAGRKAA
jgi:hypothetical protein